MKLSKFTHLLVIGLTLTIAVAGCRKRPGTITPLPGSIAGNVKDPGMSGGLGDTNAVAQEKGPAPLPEPGQFDKYDRNEDMFKEDRVYFAYDSAVVRAVEKSKVAKVADYLKANPTCAVEVDGHCDERGTEEYNRALGERRALAVREELAKLGVDPMRIPTKTFGKDRPIEPLHSEAAWSKNRRGEFILLTPPKQ